MPNRLKPYLLTLFIIWPVTFFLMKYSLNDGVERAKFEISEAVRVSGTIVKAIENRTKRSHTFWVYATVPSTHGITSCDGPISESTYRMIEEHKINKVDMYVWQGGCWTAEDRDRQAGMTLQDTEFFAIFISIIPAFLIYLAIALIPFGKSRKSLNKRWSTKNG